MIILHLAGFFLEIWSRPGDFELERRFAPNVENVYLFGIFYQPICFKSLEFIHKHTITVFGIHYIVSTPTLVSPSPCFSESMYKPRK